MDFTEDKWKEPKKKKEGNVSLKDTLNTFHGVGHVVNDY